MIKIDANNWYKLEGYILPEDEYNFTNLDGIDIWYTNVEVQLQNPNINDFIHGVNYKTRKFSDFGLNTIEEINANFNEAFLNIIREEMAYNEGALTYTEPFTITESSVICFGDAYGATLPYYVVILKDDSITKITAIDVKYDGPDVAIGEPFNYDNLIVTGYFSDGHTSRFEKGTYVVKNYDGKESGIVTKVGANVYTVTIVYGENTWTDSFIVYGVKQLVGIQAEYDGPLVALGKKPKRKNIIVIAKYSDDSVSTVTDWTFKSGTVTEANNGILTIYYQGFECNVTIGYYETYPSQIKAFYNGPKIEVGNNFSLDYLTVKIYYQDTNNINSYWEKLNYFIVDTQTITHEKDNIINVSYITEDGNILTTNFIVEGVIPEKEIEYLTAEYSGPPIQKGKTYNPEKVICKAHWNDNSVTLIKDFSVSTTIVSEIGINEFTLKHDNQTCTFAITGVDVESTTESNYSPTEIDLLYPEATKINHRRRGPMEHEKFDAYSKFVYNNITELFNIFNDLEKQYKQINSDINNLHNTGTNTLNTCVNIDERLKLLDGRR